MHPDFEMGEDSVIGNAYTKDSAISTQCHVCGNIVEGLPIPEGNCRGNLPGGMMDEAKKDRRQGRTPYRRAIPTSGLHRYEHVNILGSTDRRLFFAQRHLASRIQYQYIDSRLLLLCEHCDWNVPLIFRSFPALQ